MPDQSVDSHRWSDDKLQKFYDDFTAHIATEKIEHQQQQALYTAVFQQEDREKNVPAGLLQMMSRIASQHQEMRIWQDRQKTFIGGIIFTVSALWFFISDLGPRILLALKKLVA